MQTDIDDMKVSLKQLQELWDNDLCKNGCNYDVSPCPHCLCYQKIQELTDRIATFENILQTRKYILSIIDDRNNWIANNDTKLLYQVVGDKMYTMSASDLDALNNTLATLSGTFSIDQLVALYG